MAQATNKIKITAEDQASQQLKQITSQLEKMNSMNFTKLAASFDIITQAVKNVWGAVDKVATECTKLISEYDKVERYNNRLIATWNNIGKATGMTAKEMLDYADSLEKVTYFEAESIQTAAQTLASTQALSEKGFKRALDLSVDLAEAMGSDVPQAASVLSRALIAPEEGLGRLKTIGVSFTDAEKDVISNLMETGKQFEAQELILDKVASKYEGLAKAVADVPQNKITQINNTVGNIRENLGGALLDTISPALDVLYKRLQEIERWAKRIRMSDAEVISDYSADELNKQIGIVSARIANSEAYNGYSDVTDRQLLGNLTAEKNARDMNARRSAAAAGMNYNVAPVAVAPVAGTPTEVAVAAEVAAEKVVTLSEYLQKNRALSVEAQKAHIDNQIETARTYLSQTEEMSSERQQIYEIIDALNKQKEALEDTGKAASFLSEEFVTNFGYASSAASDLLSAVSDLFASTYEQEASILQKEMEDAKEAGTLTVEEEAEKKAKINELNKRAFEANKRNNMAQAAISGAQAAVGFLANPGGYPGIALAATAGVTTALQIAKIAQEQFTPMATGGVITQPTHILAGEAGPEAIIPLENANARGYLNNTEQSSPVVINITIEGNADEEKVFEAIERAQRTGLLPSWKYA